MTPKQAQQYILEQVDLMSQHQYPNNKDLQNQFKIGFLLAQLATAFTYDNASYYRFRDTVHKLGYTHPK